MRRLVRSEKGQAIVIVVFVFVGLLLMVGLAIDGGTLYVRRRRMQNAADAAALAGVRLLFYEQREESMDEADEAELLAEIHTLAERNEVPDTDGTAGNAVNDNIIAYYVTITGTRILNGGLAIPIGQPGSLALAGDAEGVEVDTETQFHTVLLGLIGRSSVSAEAMAAAVYVTSSGGGEYAIFADAENCSDWDKDAIHVSGQEISVTGDVHSNDRIKVSGQDNTVTGDTEYVTSCDVDDPENNEIDCVQDEVRPMPVEYNLADYALGGRAAVEAGGDYHYIDADLKTGENFVGDGLYYVTAGHLADLSDSDWTASVTVVVEDGLLKLPGSTWNLTPYIDGLLFFSNQLHSGDKACTEAVIQLSGSSHNWAGVIYAPYGLCDFNGSDNLTFWGGIFCHAVKVSGSNLNIQYGGEYMPETLDEVYLVR